MVVGFPPRFCYAGTNFDSASLVKGLGFCFRRKKRKKSLCLCSRKNVLLLEENETLFPLWVCFSGLGSQFLVLLQEKTVPTEFHIGLEHELKRTLLTKDCAFPCIKGNGHGHSITFFEFCEALQQLNLSSGCI